MLLLTSLGLVLEKGVGGEKSGGKLWQNVFFSLLSFSLTNKTTTKKNPGSFGLVFHRASASQ